MSKSPSSSKALCNRGSQYVNDSTKYGVREDSQCENDLTPPSTTTLQVYVKPETEPGDYGEKVVAIDTATGATFGAEVTITVLTP